MFCVLFSIFVAGALVSRLSIVLVVPLSASICIFQHRTDSASHPGPHGVHLSTSSNSGVSVSIDQCNFNQDQLFATISNLAN